MPPYYVQLYTQMRKVTDIHHRQTEADLRPPLPGTPNMLTGHPAQQLRPCGQPFKWSPIRKDAQRWDKLSPVFSQVKLRRSQSSHFWMPAPGWALRLGGRSQKTIPTKWSTLFSTAPTHEPPPSPNPHFSVGVLSLYISPSGNLKLLMKRFFSPATAHHGVPRNPTPIFTTSLPHPLLGIHVPETLLWNPSLPAGLPWKCPGELYQGQSSPRLPDATGPARAVCALRFW